MKPEFLRQLTRLLLACGAALFASHTAAAEARILPPPTRVSPHVYAWLGPHGGPSPENKGFRMNMVFVVGRDAVAVIEAGYHEPMAREMLAQIARITKAPVKYVINTNSQPDRFLGNETFRRQGATIIASAPEAKRMATLGGMFAQASEAALKLQPGSIEVPGQPDRIIEGEAELDLGNVKVKLYQFGPAHTPGPLVVHIPRDKVVYGGDILYRGRLPAVVDGGDVKSWIEGFDRLGTFGDVTFVPGHGKPAKLAAFEFPTRDYLSLLRKHMRKAIVQGMSQQDAIRTLDQSAFAKLENYQELAGRNASIAYIEAEADAFEQPRPIQ
jgi:glyoxylase-like metal-dependent hydrolase (beta-lactamase superfamily II)